MKPSSLVIGRTYFRLTFADRDLTMPGVEPMVFLGEVTDEGGTHGFVFQDTSSFVPHGSGLEGEEQHEDIVLYFMADADVGAHVRRGRTRHRDGGVGAPRSFAESPER